MIPELDNPLGFLARFDFEGHDEQSIRDQWISVLLRMLGYGLEGTVMRPKVLKLRPPLRRQGYHSWRLDTHPRSIGSGCGLWRPSTRRRTRSARPISGKRGGTRPTLGPTYR
jgi:hypothetical protein